MEKFLNQMAGTVIGLHEEGYGDDFERYGTDQLWDMQENRPYTLGEINITKICHVQNHNGKSKKIILAIEKTDGCKGLFVVSAMHRFFIRRLCKASFQNNKFHHIKDLE